MLQVEILTCFIIRTPDAGDLLPGLKNGRRMEFGSLRRRRRRRRRRR